MWYNFQYGCMTRVDSNQHWEFTALLNLFLQFFLALFLCLKLLLQHVFVPQQRFQVLGSLSVLPLAGQILKCTNSVLQLLLFLLQRIYLQPSFQTHKQPVRQRQRHTLLTVSMRRCLTVVCVSDLGSECCRPGDLVPYSWFASAVWLSLPLINICHTYRWWSANGSQRDQQ